MATFVLTDAVVTINAVNLSAWCTSLTLSVEVDDQENTAMGSGFRSRLGGLKEWSIDVDLNADFGASAVDETVYPLLGQTVPVTIKATSAPTSPTNPIYSGTALISEYTPIDGGVGDLATTSVSWPGSGVLTRATA
ncbi:hypothetical protein [Actinomadura sp. NEAU-AAG7]|uniref:hypothetical protein n=1 Tax=Actinomadura sp. NEAU-AAG7 TaxID=2839640 RepID=UPI001BE464BB|nr:hypothetical protein [Actinomadura sp. NEAU-AAG7]MBT2213460.1 hypothetical protein [Actinomadura sp. NEAU-AAG7]